jgi:hypothetical protein
MEHHILDHFNKVPVPCIKNLVNFHQVHGVAMNRIITSPGNEAVEWYHADAMLLKQTKCLSHPPGKEWTQVPGSVVGCGYQREAQTNLGQVDQIF